MNTASDPQPAVPHHLGSPPAGDEAEFEAATDGQPATATPDLHAWRSEVAARLARYRTRRKPRAPRYPSLLLPFDASESWSRPSAPTTAAAAPLEDRDFALDPPDSGEAISGAPVSPESEPQPGLPREIGPEPSAKVIEFPRSAAIPVFHSSPLADPIFDRPRIVEAPEVLPPPPALGGILIEPVQQPADRRAGDTALIPSASVGRRLGAAALDGVFLAVAVSAFGAIFLRFNPLRGPLSLLAGVNGVIAVLFWMAYQFLFIVYTGSTPGLRAARLELTKLDGSAVNLRARRWRVLASFLSAFSAGLGYLWCLLDQDSLCWHDRISRTHLQLAGSKRVGAKPAGSK